MQPTHAKIHYHRLLYLCEQAFPSVVAQSILAAIISQTLIAANEPLSSVLFWLAFFIMTLSTRLLIAKQFMKLTKQNKPIDKQQIRFYTDTQTLLIFIVGLLWSWAVYSFISIEDEHYLYAYQMISVAFTVGIIGVSVSVLSSIPKVFYLFTAPLSATLLISIFLVGSEPFHYAVLGGILIGLLFFSASSYHFTKRFDENVIKNYTIENREMELINRLGIASEFRDTETGNHINRMSYSCYLLALEAGFSKKQAELIRVASSLHDIGKLGISDKILLKHGKLSPEEREIMQNHAEIGANILADSDSEMIQMAQRIAQNHHEKVDGTGYPKGLKGYEIPIEAKIAAICDVFDALTSNRPYKEAWPNEKALAYVIEQSGSHFDTQLVKKFIKIYPKVIAYSKAHSKQAK